MNRISAAQVGSPDWTPERQQRVLLSIQEARRDRAARARALSIALSSVVGMVLIVMAVRAFGGSSRDGGPAQVAAPIFAHDDGGAREN